MTTQLRDVEQVIRGLHASPPESLPFAPSLQVRAFVLRRQRGNVLVYAAPGLDPVAPALRDLGGVSRRYLTHRHEAMFAGEAGPPLFVHELERREVERHLPVRATFSRRHTLDGDLELIPTPGHTPGATALLWETPEHRLLFTGDTVYLRGGEWVAAVLPGSSDRAAYLESLALIRELDFDVLVPWVAAEGEPFYASTSRSGARRRIDAIIRRLRSGAGA
jgi:glyoxylase-like metal-dependent hydrolase (beta-lactamase superfamily II)